VLDDFEPARAADSLRALGRNTPMIRTAARRRPELEPWLAWLERELARPRELARSRVLGPALRPRFAAASGA